MKRPLGELRIIGGEWRSRRVAFDADPRIGLRATPDRVRQTLFDWLMPILPGAHCLDLFAGAGSLGLEALSRGAAHCTFVDTGAQQIADIRSALERLGGQDRARVLLADARQQLATRHALGQYDIVFLDPPFGSGLLAATLPLLPAHLKPTHRVYCEWAGAAPPLPTGWVWLKDKQAGRVSFGLARCESSPP